MKIAMARTATSRDGRDDMYAASPHTTDRRTFSIMNYTLRRCRITAWSSYELQKSVYMLLQLKDIIGRGGCSCACRLSCTADRADVPHRAATRRRHIRVLRL